MNAPTATSTASPVQHRAESTPRIVLHVFGVMNRGGAEMRTVELLRRVSSEDVRLLFCVLSGKRGSLDDEIRQYGGEVVYCGLGAAFPVRFVRVLRREHVGVVHSHVATFSGFLLLLARLAGIRVRIAHFRSDGDGHRDRLRRRAQRRIMRALISRNATNIIGVSNSALEHGWRSDWTLDARCELVHDGVDVSRYGSGASVSTVKRDLGVAPGDKLCLHIGNAGPEKNRLRAVRVLAALRRRDAPASLVFVGAGGPEDVLVAREAAKLGEAEHVHFAGERTDVPRLLRTADLLLVTSTREGLPGVVLEACAAGTPVLASDLPGVREIARYCREVFPQPLSAPDDEWAAIGRDLLERGVREEAREAALRSFAAGPFALDRSLARFLDLWGASAVSPK